MPINEALIDVVKALGGSKQVAPLLWPTKAPDAAQRLLLGCLNEDRPEHLTPDQVIYILKLARDRGIHTGVNAICSVLGYAEPTPIEPRDEAAELQRQYIEATRSMAAIAARMEKLAPALRVAA